MQFSFIGNDFGIFVLGRKILAQFPQADIQFFLRSKTKNEAKNSDIALCSVGFEQMLHKTRFGRIGIFLDRKNMEFCRLLTQKIATLATLAYHPQCPKRALEKPEITLFQTQVVREFALEGLADSVEFRRLMRKFIRRAKNHHCDVLFFPELIFGEAKTKKIIQHLAGSQMRVFTGDDFLTLEVDKNKKRQLRVFYPAGEEVDFLHQRCEQILCTKLSKEVFVEGD